MKIPMWLILGVATLVGIFGAYRLSLAFRSGPAQARARARRGLFGQARTTQALWGVVYLLMAAGLVATAFGWNPLHVRTPAATPAIIPVTGR